MLDTKILLIRTSPLWNTDYTHPQDIRWPITLLYTSSILKKKGYQVSLIDLWPPQKHRDDVLNILHSQTWNIVIVEATSNEWPIVDKLLAVAKKDHALTIAVGHQTCHQNSKIYSSQNLVDIGIHGEYDACIEQVVYSLLHNQTLNLDGVIDLRNNHYKFKAEAALNKNLDNLPYLDLSNIKINAYDKISSCINQWGRIRWGFLETSRGCPYSCIFCSPILRLSYGKEYRHMSPQRIVNEINHLKKQGVNTISFCDDLFTGDPDYIIELCDIMNKTEVKIPWVAQTALLKLNEKLVNKMKQAGCQGLSMGVESGSNRILKMINKNLTLDIIHNKIKIVQQAKIPMTLYFMVGFPTETLEEIETTIKLIKTLKPLLIQVAFFTPYLGSSWYKTAPDKLTNNIHHYNKVSSFYNKTISANELVKIQRKIYKSHYCTPQFILSYLKYNYKNVLTSSRGLSVFLKGFKYLYLSQNNQHD